MLSFLYILKWKKKIEKDSVDFWHRKMTLKVRIVMFFTLQKHNFGHTKNHKWRVGCRHDFTKLNFGNCSFIIRWDIVSEIKHAKFCLLFLFVKFCWNSEIGWNLTSPLKKCPLNVVWMTWNFLTFHEILNQIDAENFRFLSWQTKKFYS